ncbi:GGDEF and EAL domain-containing protein [Aquipuribacter sp. SD81]|uniref:GGDEF and EAL domain-containing protein n=1 Tax=Aquipuribacter sp. SD81 TaxID=3127703 RepID=UPI003017E4A1
MTRSGALASVCLLLGLAVYAVLGPVPLGWVDLYVVVSGGAVALGWWQLERRAPQQPWAWRWLLAGYTAWVVGDLVWTWENGPDGPQWFPGVADVLYLLGYVGLGAGAMVMVRVRATARDRTAVLDAVVVAVGVAVPTVAFLVQPAAADADLSTAGKVVASAYPLLDVFLLAVLARLLTTPGARTPAFGLLAGSLVLTFCADAAWNAGVVLRGDDFVSRWTDVGWLAAYSMLTVAVGSRGLHDLAERQPGRQGDARLRLVALGAASALPGLTLAAGAALGREVAWWPVAAGVVVLSSLVLARMAGMLERVRAQAVQLSALARVDGLTGAPNRRTWDHELSRACAHAAEHREPLAVGLLDLDRFKRYNDRHGHQAGDRLLVAAVSAWSDALPERAMLARYGGEEFAVLLPGLDLEAGRLAVDRLRGTTPQGQTFSAGVAAWLPGTEPGAAVAAADAALYEAKRRGRDRVVADPAAVRAGGLPRWAEGARVVLQPVVDARDGRVIGHEALARLPGLPDVAGALLGAHEDGVGDLVEAHLVRLALQVPGRPPGTSLFVNVSPAAVASRRFWDGLPADLDGVVVELVEEHVGRDWSTQRRAVQALRERGARIAVDDLGAGSGDLGRVLAVRPDVVKVDRGVVHGCHADEARLELVRLVVQLAAAVGARVCAEGVEDDADLEVLREVGVQLVQGYHLGVPSPRWVTGPVVPGGAAGGEGPVGDPLAHAST